MHFDEKTAKAGVVIEGGISLNLRFTAALFAGKATALFCKAVKKGGTNKPGAIACKICPDFIKRFTNVDLNKVIFITGTNGKSTTNNMVVHTLRSAGETVTTNLEGANLMGGVATAMLNNSTLSGIIETEYLVFEVDERYLQYIYAYFPAGHICVTNIQIDQVQRNGEPDYIYQKIRRVVNEKTHLYLNNEEPRVFSLADRSSQITTYGVERNVRSFEKTGFFDVTLPCPRCGNNIKFDYYNLDNVGKFHCTVCDFASADKPDIYLTHVDFDNGSFDCDGISYHVNNKEPFFYYNYALCIALCRAFGITEEQIQTAFNDFKNISGRMETLHYGSKIIKYIRIKQENPETLQTAFDYISADPSPKVFLLGLEELKDFDPYYTNTFYAFGVNVDRLEASNIDHYICFSEAVAYDTANRLLYGGIDPEKITILPNDDNDAILKELDRYDNDNVYLITWLKKYYELDETLKERNKNHGND